MIIAVRRKLMLAGWVLLLTACGDGSSTRVCFGSESFCRDAFTANQTPHADAGPDLEAVAGTRVSLDGSESRDPDGSVASYSWSQESGPVVAISQATASVAAFDAPEVDEPTTLTFRLLVTDHDGASDADRVSVSVTPAMVAALRQMVTRLDRDPPPVCGTAAAPSCWKSLGLWLGARVHAAQALREPDSTALLDALRVLSMTHDRPPPAALPAELREVFELGQRATASFTRTLDPATAERARRLGPGPRPRPEDWQAALRGLDALAERNGPGGAQTGSDRLAVAALVRALKLRRESG